MPSEPPQVRVEFTPEFKVTIYSKLDQADISAEQIRRILTEFDEHFG
ncbi:MAG: hypothetical protein H8D43_04365 [Chloroflexi bacterium]|nr:hypothetical protein [Chloroflexota bacterium]